MLLVNRPVRNTKNYTMDFNGGSQTPVTDGILPSWNPDGSKIAFISTENYELYDVSPNGTNRRQLTSDGSIKWLHAYSPDGTEIVIQYKPSGNEEIGELNSNGGSITNLTNNLSNDYLPDF